MGFTQMMLDEGRQEGRQEQAMTTLNQLLSLRFKNIPAWAKELLEKAELENLKQWTGRIMDAENIEEVFGKHQ
ncbi:hypothetical protein QUF76_09630 [Desulfobacterales bacterium HSG16]|nr:hypothetical protein [Desulfobacterales bacterium HSG16]